MRLLLFVVVFLFLGAFFIVSNGNLHLANSGEFMQFGDAYYSWLGSLFGNVQSVAGYAVKSEWLPSSNSSFQTSGE